MREPYYSDDWIQMWAGDNRAVLLDLPERSVHMAITSPPYYGLRSYLDADDPSKHLEIGSEESLDDYIGALVDVSRHVRRVLRDDGTFWLNLGDGYAGPPKGSNNGWDKSGLTKPKDGRPRTAEMSSSGMVGRKRLFSEGVKAKDLIGVPWRAAFALQADGWYLRNAIVWNTPNPMPESVNDRLTNSYEMVFLFAKQPKYFFDQDAIREPHTEVTLNRIEYGLKHRHPEGIGVAIPPVDTDRMGERFAHPLGRNKRDVWTIATTPYKGAHYAVFPTALVEPMVKAGTSERGCCVDCGAPWRRVVENDEGTIKQSWEPTCGDTDNDGNPLPTEPCTVLDPFAGSGTVGLVAQSLSRRSVLIDLNPEYLKIQLDRNTQTPLGL